MSAVTSSSFPYFLYTTTSQQPMSQTLNEAPLTSLLVGFTVGSVLFGVVLLESYRYFQTYKSDPRQLKLLVILVCGLDGLDFALSIHILFHYYLPMVPDWVNLPLIWSAKTLGIVQIILLWIVESVHFIRICNISKKLLNRTLENLVYGLVAFSAIISLAVGFAFTVEIILVGSILDFTKLKWEFCVFFGANAAIALVITVVSIYLLHRSVTGIKRTDDVLSFLIHYFFNAGLMLGLFAMISLVLYVVKPEKLYFLGMVFSLGRLCTISLLERLNIRKQLRENMGQDITLEPLSSFRIAPRPPDSHQTTALSYVEVDLDIQNLSNRSRISGTKSMP